MSDGMRDSRKTYGPIPVVLLNQNEGKPMTEGDERIKYCKCEKPRTSTARGLQGKFCFVCDKPVKPDKQPALTAEEIDERFAEVTERIEVCDYSHQCDRARSMNMDRDYRRALLDLKDARAELASYGTKSPDIIQIEKILQEAVDRLKSRDDDTSSKG